MRAECGKAGSVAAIMMVASIIACSGGSSEPGGAHDRCSSVSACGGSLTGSWNITSTCGQLSIYTFGTDCPGAMLDQSGITQSGTLTFKADMTFLHVITTHGTTKETAPPSCLAQLNQSSCEEWASNMGSLPEATHACTTEGSVCKCTS